MADGQSTSASVAEAFGSGGVFGGQSTNGEGLGGFVSAVTNTVANSTLGLVARSVTKGVTDFIGYLAEESSVTRNAVAAGLKGIKDEKDPSKAIGAFYREANSYQEKNGVVPGTGLVPSGPFNGLLRSARISRNPYYDRLADDLDKGIISGKIGVNIPGINMDALTKGLNLSPQELKALDNSVVVSGPPNELFNATGIPMDQILGFNIGLLNDGIPGGLIAISVEEDGKVDPGVLTHEAIHALDRAVDVISDQIDRSSLSKDEREIVNDAREVSALFRDANLSILDFNEVAEKAITIAPEVLDKQEESYMKLSEVRAYTRATSDPSVSLADLMSRGHIDFGFIDFGVSPEEAAELEAMFKDSAVLGMIDGAIDNFIGAGYLKLD